MPATAISPALRPSRAAKRASQVILGPGVISITTDAIKNSTKLAVTPQLA
jgi:hypothetical protein